MTIYNTSDNTLNDSQRRQPQEPDALVSGGSSSYNLDLQRLEESHSAVSPVAPTPRRNTNDPPGLLLMRGVPMQPTPGTAETIVTAQKQLDPICPYVVVPASRPAIGMKKQVQKASEVNADVEQPTVRRQDAEEEKESDHGGPVTPIAEAVVVRYGSNIPCRIYIFFGIVFLILLGTIVTILVLLLPSKLDPNHGTKSAASSPQGAADTRVAPTIIPPNVTTPNASQPLPNTTQELNIDASTTQSIATSSLNDPTIDANITASFLVESITTSPSVHMSTQTPMESQTLEETTASPTTPSPTPQLTTPSPTSPSTPNATTSNPTKSPTSAPTNKATTPSLTNAPTAKNSTSAPIRPPSDSQSTASTSNATSAPTPVSFRGAAFETFEELKLAIDSPASYLSDAESPVSLKYGYPMGQWNVSRVTSLDAAFYQYKGPLHDLSSWDTSLLTNMHWTFAQTDYNWNVGSWNVARVRNMDGTFWQARNFNSDISSWNVESVVDMQGLFATATVFNQDLSSWNVANCENMYHQFYEAQSFNTPLSSWKVSKVTSMQFMFDSAINFNQDISSWPVKSLTNMIGMFAGARSFSRNLCAWNEHLVQYVNFAQGGENGAFRSTACPRQSHPGMGGSAPYSPLCYVCS